MKLKSLIFLSLLLSITSVVFAQEKTGAPAVKKATPADDKTAKPAPPPTVSEIIARYVQASGGRENISRIRNRVITAGFTMAGTGLSGEMEMIQAQGDKSYMKMVIPGMGDIIAILDGEKGWASDPMSGLRDIDGDELKQLKISGDLYRDINFSKHYPDVVLKGIEKVGDRDAYVITATPKGLPAETFYFDKETGLLLRADSISITVAGRTVSKTSFDDYREIDKVKIPYKTRIVSSIADITIEVTDVKHDVEIDNGKFSRPKN